ncbi:hypothetical protein JFY65_05420 [Porphyromonas gingivalis]|nr:hypothetical protein [Porphyromonas gingivalis]MCE8193595.1 hypothetical protein [Porphyromonas gingivalis]
MQHIDELAYVFVFATYHGYKFDHRRLYAGGGFVVVFVVLLNVWAF